MTRVTNSQLNNSDDDLPNHALTLPEYDIFLSHFVSILCEYIVIMKNNYLLNLQLRNLNDFYSNLISDHEKCIKIYKFI